MTVYSDGIITESNFTSGNLKMRKILNLELIFLLIHEMKTFNH